MRARGVAYRRVFTEASSTGCARGAGGRRAGETCVVMSGDGLIGQVGGELAGTGAPLGVIPGGRGNDLARVARDPERGRAGGRRARRRRRARDRRRRGERQALPLHRQLRLRLRRQPDRERDARSVRGALVYAYAALRALVAWKPATFTVTLDGERKQCHRLHGRRRQRQGLRRWHVSPRRMPSSTTACSTSAPPATSASCASSAACAKVFEGEHLDDAPGPGVARRRRSRIEADRPFAVYADGEHLTDLPVTVADPAARPARDRARDERRTGPTAGCSREGGARPGDRRAQPPQRPRRRHHAAGPAAAAPGARRDLAARRPASAGGSTVDQRHQRQDDHRGHARRGAAGRGPRSGPQPRRLEHELGRRHRAARAARRRGAVRGRRGVAAADGRRARPAPGRARQPLSRPARPLRRARAARRRLGGAGRPRAPGRSGFVLNADDPLVADLGRDRELQPARRASPTSESRTPRRRCPSSSTPTTPSTAAAAARPTSTSAPSSATSATTAARTAAPTAPRRTSPRPRSSCAGMEGSRSSVRTPGGRGASSSSPCPGLYNVYNALAALAAALRLGVGLEPAVAGARARSRRHSGGSRRSRSARPRCRSC